MIQRLASIALVLFLAGCATTPSDATLHHAVDSLDQAVLEGRKAPESALDAYEALYKKYPSNPITVSAYADALRRSNHPQKAAQVLRPFVEKNDVKTMSSDVFIAYMRLLIDQGFNKDAEVRLRTRLTLPAEKLTDPASLPQISNLLGVSLANQGRKAEAEQAFRVALAHWDGRPGVVEKNLARLKAKPSK